MKTSLKPLQIAADEWILMTPDGQLGNRAYPSRAACQKTIDGFNAALPDILMAAEEVVTCWERGDLAGAVRELDQTLRHAWGA